MFGDLPAGLADQSLQFAGHGSVQATVLDVNAVTSFVDQTPNTRVKELEDQEIDILKQIRALDDRTGVLDEERDFVKRMLVSTPTVGAAPADGTHGGVGPGLPPLEEWQKLFSYSEETLGKIAAEVQSIDARRDELKGKKAAVDAELEGLRGDRGKSVKVVTVRLSVPTACKLEVALKYALPGATWAPSYDARLLTGERAVELSYYGLVWNATGEDWRYALSSSRFPRRGRAWAAAHLSSGPGWWAIQRPYDSLAKSEGPTHRDPLSRGDPAST